jgi:hypothetical protein
MHRGLRPELRAPGGHMHRRAIEPAPSSRGQRTVGGAHDARHQPQRRTKWGAGPCQRPCPDAGRPDAAKGRGHARYPTPHVHRAGRPGAMAERAAGSPREGAASCLPGGAPAYRHPLRGRHVCSIADPAAAGTTGSLLISEYFRSKPSRDGTPPPAPKIGSRRFASTSPEPDHSPVASLRPPQAHPRCPAYPRRGTYRGRSPPTCSTGAVRRWCRKPAPRTSLRDRGPPPAPIRIPGSGRT